MTTGISGALRHRSFRLYFAGQCLSLLGTWMQHFALLWMAYRITGSVALLGVAGFAMQFPILALAPVSGTLADRHDRRGLLFLTQGGAMLLSLLLAALTLAGTMNYPLLLGLALALGVANALDTPMRQALLSQLVDKADMSQAIALNSLLVNGARLAGPAVAGLVIAAAGEGWCYLLNAASYGAMLLALWHMRPRQVPAQHRAGFAEALRHVRERPALRNILALTALTGFAVSPYSALLPALVAEQFTQSAVLTGALAACAGTGAFAATLFMVFRRRPVPVPQALAGFAACAGAGLALLPVLASPAALAAALAVSAFGVVALGAEANMLLQDAVPEALRGRVVSLYVMAFLGMYPIGSLAMGALAQMAGSAAALAGGGMLVLLAAWVYWLRRRTGACLTPE
jgi:MFS family permease